MPSVLHKPETYTTVVEFPHILFSQIQTFFALEWYIISCLTGFFILVKTALFGCLQCDFFSIRHGPHGLRRASGEGDILSPHGALRA